MTDPEPRPAGTHPWWRHNIVLIAFMAIAAFYLYTEHEAHLLGVFPWLLLLACPLMHMFMHRGHGAHHGHGRDRNSSSTREGG